MLLIKKERRVLNVTTRKGLERRIMLTESLKDFRQGMIVLERREGPDDLSATEVEEMKLHDFRWRERLEYLFDGGEIWFPCGQYRH